MLWLKQTHCKVIMLWCLWHCAIQCPHACSAVLESTACQSAAAVLVCIPSCSSTDDNVLWRLASSRWSPPSPLHRQPTCPSGRTTMAPPSSTCRARQPPLAQKMSDRRPSHAFKPVAPHLTELAPLPRQVECHTDPLSPRSTVHLGKSLRRTHVTAHMRRADRHAGLTQACRRGCPGACGRPLPQQQQHARGAAWDQVQSRGRAGPFLA